jgi:hypothetical protein
MAKFWLCVAAAAACAAAVVGCEDNPDQFYKKAPPGAGDKWNDTNTAGTYDPNARNGFNDTFNTSSKDELCPGPVKHKVWADAVTRPIVPPKDFGGLDLRGGDGWTGLTFTDAQKPNVLCQATPAGTDDDHLVAQWGDAGEISVEYLVSTNVIDFVQLNAGYVGTLDFHSRTDADSQTMFGHPNPFKQHTYQWAPGQPVRRDGVPWLLNWGTTALDDKQATEMFDALMATFAPELTGDQDSCSTAQTCLVRLTGVEGVFGARPLGMYFHIPVVNAPQPAASTPDYLYAFYVKLMPFSTSEMFLKLDKDGPISTARGLGDKKTTCTQKLGMSYADFLGNCVTVKNADADNQFLVGKLLGGMAHTKEVFNLSVQGIDTDFASSIIGDDKVIADDWKPTATDKIYHFNMDIRASGKLLNEYSEDGNTFTFGATGAIYREYARRTQADIQRMMKTWDPSFTPHNIGDPACLMGAKDDPNKWGPGKEHGPAKGCTGFEQFVTPGERTTPDGAGIDKGVRTISIGARAQADPFDFNSALKPGDPVGVFCVDPSPNPDGKDIGDSCTADSECWSMSCSGDDGKKTCDDITTNYFKHCGGTGDPGASGPILDASYNRVIDYLGGGNPLNVPPTLRDRKYYFQQLGFAIVKYLHAAGNSPRPTNLFALGPNDCNGKSCEPEMDHLQFDQIGASADRAKLEYIDRRFVDDGVEPLSYEYEILIVSGNQQESRFQRMLERDEKTVFLAMSEDRTQPLANPKDNVRLTNIIGSPVIAGGPWQGVSDKKDAWFCGTHDDAECKAADPTNSPPRIGGRPDSPIDLDDNGEPILTQYKGAFAGAETAFSLGTAHLKMVEEEPLIKSARVAVPIFDDPYKAGATTTTAAGPQVKVTLPDWRPLAPGAGFRIPVNAQRDRFIPAAQVDFSGQNISMALNYQLNDSDKSMKILGVETQTFEGELFMCQDPRTKDLLHVRQYDSVADVLDWLEKHPGAREACDILVRFSPFNESPISITSKSAGVQVTVGQGVGIGRIIDALFYDVTL